MNKTKVAIISVVAIVVVVGAAVFALQRKAPAPTPTPTPTPSPTPSVANETAAVDSLLSELEDFISLENADFDFGLRDVMGNWG